MNWILIPLIGGVLLYLESAKAFKDKYSIDIKSVRFDKAKTFETGFITLFFDLKLIVSNPTDFSGKAESVTLTIFYQGIKIASVKNQDPISIKPNSNEVILKIAVPTVKMIKVVPDFLNRFKGGATASVNVSGTMKMLSGTAHFKKTIPLSLTA